MTTPTHLDRLHRRGVRFHIDGDRLRWIAPAGVVTKADLTALREHKADVMAILREEEHDRIEERAAIIQYDAGMTREKAEQRAQAEIERSLPRQRQSTSP